VRCGLAWLSLFAVLVSASMSPLAAAEEELKSESHLIPEAVEGVDEGAKPGWHPMLTLSGNLALSHNQGVVGNPNGLNLMLGYLIASELGYLDDTKQHEWQNTLGWQLAYTRTATVEKFVKSIDSFDLQSAYLYHLPPLPWVGPFIAFQLRMSVFPGYDIRADSTEVVELDPDGDPVQRTDPLGNPIGNRMLEAGDRLGLTGAFEPIQLRETVGMFAIPVEKEIVKVDVRAGFGAWETLVQDGKVIVDDEATPELEIQQLQDSVLLGPELRLAVTGLYKENIIYGVRGLLMYPVYHSVDTRLEGGEKLNTEIEALLGIKFAPWLSIDYSLKAYRLPFIVDQWQIQNVLLVSITLSLIGEEDAPPACPEGCVPG
jgi:hypothetical protein